MKIKSDDKLYSVSQKQGYISYYSKYDRNTLIAAAVSVLVMFVWLLLPLLHKILFILSLPTGIYLIRQVYKLSVLTVEHLKIQTIFPLSKKDMTINKINSISDYSNFVNSVFRFRPFRSTVKAINSTATREFGQELELTDKLSLPWFLIRSFCILCMYLISIILMFTCKTTDFVYDFISMLIWAFIWLLNDTRFLLNPEGDDDDEF